MFCLGQVSTSLWPESVSCRPGVTVSHSPQPELEPSSHFSRRSVARFPPVAIHIAVKVMSIVVKLVWVAITRDRLVDVEPGRQMNLRAGIEVGIHNRVRPSVPRRRRSQSTPIISELVMPEHSPQPGFREPKHDPVHRDRLG